MLNFFSQLANNLRHYNRSDELQEGSEQNSRSNIKRKTICAQILKRNIKKSRLTKSYFSSEMDFRISLTLCFISLSSLCSHSQALTSSRFVYFSDFSLSSIHFFPCALILFCVPHSSQLWLLTSAFDCYFTGFEFETCTKREGKIHEYALIMGISCWWWAFSWKRCNNSAWLRNKLLCSSE